MSNPTPSHAEIIANAMARHTSEMRVALPGRVQAYNAANQSADVQPLILDGDGDPDDGTRVTVQLPVITDVPIVFPGSKAGRLTFPIVAGDTVLLVFSSSSLDLWLQIGGLVDPADDRRHNISDAVAIPGLFDFAHVPGTASTTAVVLSGTIALGDASATSPIARQSDLQALVNSIKSIFTSAAVVANDGGSALKTNVAAALGALAMPACSSSTKAT